MALFNTQLTECVQKKKKEIDEKKNGIGYLIVCKSVGRNQFIRQQLDIVG